MVEARRSADVPEVIGGLYDPGRYAKRVDALASAPLGVAGASLAAVVGQTPAQARGLVTKHAAKPVDRLPSNAGIDVWDSFARRVPQQVGTGRDVLVAMNRTDFDHDGPSTLVPSQAKGHGRTAPRVWPSVWKEEIAPGAMTTMPACAARREPCRSAELAKKHGARAATTPRHRNRDVMPMTSRRITRRSAA